MAAYKSLTKDQRFNTGFQEGNHRQMAYCREVLLRSRRFPANQRTTEYLVQGVRNNWDNGKNRVSKCFELIKNNGKSELEDLVYILVGPVLKCLYPHRVIHRPKVKAGKEKIVYYDQEQFLIRMRAPFSPKHVWEMHMILGLLRYVVTLYGSEKKEHRELVEKLLAENDDLDLGRKDSCLRWISDHQDVYKMFSTVSGHQKFRVFWALLEHGERPSYLGRDRQYPLRFTYWDGLACAAIRKKLNAEGKVE